MNRAVTSELRPRFKPAAGIVFVFVRTPIKFICIDCSTCWTNMRTQTKRTRGTENPDAFIPLNMRIVRVAHFSFVTQVERQLCIVKRGYAIVTKQQWGDRTNKFRSTVLQFTYCSTIWIISGGSADSRSTSNNGLQSDVRSHQSTTSPHSASLFTPQQLAIQKWVSGKEVPCNDEGAICYNGAVLRQCLPDWCQCDRFWWWNEQGYKVFF
jgi:hypothetical protein